MSYDSGVIENNKLIAEFIKIKLPLSVIQFSATICLHNGNYHKDWNWIMPVVEIIETTQYMVNHPKRSSKMSDIFISTDYQDHPDFPKGWNANVMTTTMGDIYRSDRKDEIFYSKLQATYIAVVKFIKWYNEENKI